MMEGNVNEVLLAGKVYGESSWLMMISELAMAFGSIRKQADKPWVAIH